MFADLATSIARPFDSIATDWTDRRGREGGLFIANIE